MMFVANPQVEEVLNLLKEYKELTDDEPIVRFLQGSVMDTPIRPALYSYMPEDSSEEEPLLAVITIPNIDTGKEEDFLSMLKLIDFLKGYNERYKTKLDKRMNDYMCIVNSCLERLRTLTKLDVSVTRGLGKSAHINNDEGVLVSIQVGASTTRSELTDLLLSIVHYADENRHA